MLIVGTVYTVQCRCYSSICPLVEFGFGGLTHPSHKPIISPVQDLGIGQGNRVGWLVSVDVIIYKRNGEIPEIKIPRTPTTKLYSFRGLEPHHTRQAIPLSFPGQCQDPGQGR